MPEPVHAVHELFVGPRLGARLIIQRAVEEEFDTRASSDSIFCGSSTMPLASSLSMLACISADGGAGRLTA